MSVEKQAWLDASARGMRCMPIVGKRPILKGWPTRGIADEETIDYWLRQWPTCNMAFITGRWDGDSEATVRLFYVLDVDPDAGGLESLARLEEMIGKLPETHTVITGGDGLHFYLERPDGVTIRSSVGKLGPGLDIRADGGQVVAPPSVHKSGRLYCQRGDVTAFASFPALVNLIKEGSAAELPTRSTAPRASTPGDAGTRAWWQDDGDGVHVCILALSGGLLRRGMLPSQAIELMTAVLPPRSTPQPNEIKAAVESTQAALEQGRDDVTGWPTLRRILGDAGLAELNERLGITPPGQGQTAMGGDDRLPGELVALSAPASTILDGAEAEGVEVEEAEVGADGEDAGAGGEKVEAEEVQANDTGLPPNDELPEGMAPPMNTPLQRQTTDWEAPEPMDEPPMPETPIERLRDASVRWTSEFQLARAKAEATNLKLTTWVEQGIISYEDACNLVDLGDVGPLSPEELAARRDKVLVAGIGLNRWALPAPLGVLEVCARPPRKGGDTAPFRYTTTIPELPENGAGWIVVARTGAAARAAARAMGAPDAKVVTPYDLVEGEPLVAKCVVIWEPARVISKLIGGPQLGKKSRGERTAALATLIQQAITVVGYDVIATDHAEQMLQLWRGSLDLDVATESISIAEMTWWACETYDEVLANVVAASRRKERVLLAVPFDDVEPVVDTLIEEGVNAESWGSMMADPSSVQVWVQAVGATMPARIGRIDTYAVDARLSKVGWTEAFADVLAAAPETRKIYARLSGGHNKATTLPAIGEEFRAVKKRRRKACRQVGEPNAEPHKKDATYTATAIRGRMFRRQTTWSVARVARQAWMYHGGRYRRAERPDGVGEELYEEVKRRREEAVAAATVAGQQSKTVSRQWMDDAESRPLEKTEKAYWLATSARDAMGPDIVGTMPPTEGMEDPIRDAAIELWSKQSGRDLLRRGAARVALRTNMTRAAFDRDIQEERSGFAAHGSGWGGRLVVGMIVANLLQPQIAEWDKQAHPQESNEISRNLSGGVLVWAKPHSVVPMPPGVANAELLVDKSKDAVALSGWSDCMPRVDANPCQWLGAAQRQAGITTRYAGDVTRTETIDGKIVRHKFHTYSVNIAELLLNLKLARWMIAQSLGYEMPDSLSPSTVGDEWKDAVDAVTDMWEPRYPRIQDTPWLGDEPLEEVEPSTASTSEEGAQPPDTPLLQVA